MGRRKVPFTIYLRQDQADALKHMHHRTRVPVASMIRDAIDMHIQGETLGDVIPINFKTSETLISIDCADPESRAWKIKQ